MFFLKIWILCLDLYPGQAEIDALGIAQVRAFKRGEGPDLLLKGEVCAAFISP